MRRINYFIFIFIVLIATLAISFSCTLPEKEVEEEPVYYQDQPYQMQYQEDGYTYKIDLDGAGVGTMYRSASSVQSLTGLDFRFLNGVHLNFSLQNSEYSINDGESRLLFALSDRTLIKADYNMTPPSNVETSKEKKYDVEYVYTYTKITDNHEVQCKEYIIFRNGYPGADTIDFRIEMVMSEYEYAKGEYAIEDNNKIKLDMNVEYPPSGCFRSQEINRTVAASEGWIANDYDGKGIVRIEESNYRFKYVQLYDDGTFMFLMTPSGPLKEATLTSTFRGKTFTQFVSTYYKGDRYTYTLELKFSPDLVGGITYQVKDCKTSRYYKIHTDEEQNLNLEQIYYDAALVAQLKGSHPQYGTSNNFSFAKQEKVMVDYEEKYYEFVLSDVKVEEYEKFKYLIIENDKAKFGIYLYNLADLEILIDKEDEENPRQYVRLKKDREFIKVYLDPVKLTDTLYWQWDKYNIVAP